jgi:hypothetical protein
MGICSGVLAVIEERTETMLASLEAIMFKFVLAGSALEVDVAYTEVAAAPCDEFLPVVWYCIEA